MYIYTTIYYIHQYINIHILLLIIFAFLFFNWDSLHARLNSQYEARSFKKKKHKKIRARRKSV